MAKRRGGLAKALEIEGSIKQNLASVQDQLTLSGVISEEHILESTKKAIVDDLSKLIAPMEFDKIRFLIKKLQVINENLLKFIEEEKQLARVQEKLEKKQLKCLKDDIIDEERAKALINGFVEHLPKEIAGQVKHLNGFGVLGLHEVRGLLEEVGVKGSRELETLLLITQELSSLEDNIRTQEGLCRQLLRHSKTPRFGLFKEARYQRKHCILSKSAHELILLIQKELTYHNKLLRDAGYRDLVVREKGEKISRVIWLGDREQRLAEEIELLAMQSELPKLIFPSGNFASYGCSRKDVLEIIGAGFIDERNLAPSDKVSLELAFIPVDVGYIGYRVNDVAPDSMFCFIFPLETLIKDRLFLWEKDSGENLEVLCPTGEEFSRWAGDKEADFDHIIATMSVVAKKWFEEAKLVNRRLRKRWDETAKKVVEGDFATRWIKEHEFEAEVNLVYRVLFSRYDKEALLRMSRKQLVSALKESKSYYLKCVKAAKDYNSKAGVAQDISEGLFFAPRREVLFWERHFKRIDYRPNIVYYDSVTAREGVLELWEKHKANLHEKALPFFDELEVHEVESGASVKRLH